MSNQISSIITSTTSHSIGLKSAMEAIDSKESFSTFITAFYSLECPYFRAEYDGDLFLDWQEAMSEVYFPSFDEWEQFCLDLGIA